jgi:hypothetical protein
MGILDKLKEIKDRDKPTLDELSPFGDEDFDEVTLDDHDDSVLVDGPVAPVGPEAE